MSAGRHDERGGGELSPRARPGRAWVRCYAELNDLLTPACRFTDIPVDFDAPPSVKDLIERLGVPHTEVDLIIVEGESVDFSHRVRDGDRIAVYPKFEAIDIGSIARVRPSPLREVRFVLDTHLGRLARYLRLGGFDVDYATDREDVQLVRVSVQEARIVLTRDRGLLKRGEVSHGYLVRETVPRAQFVEVLRRFDLADRLTPFTRCLECNGVLRDATLEATAERVPPGARRQFQRFRACPDCERVYWEGSHYARLARLVDEVRLACSRPDSP